MSVWLAAARVPLRNQTKPPPDTPGVTGRPGCLHRSPAGAALVPSEARWMKRQGGRRGNVPSP